ncbi:MAG: hypothetical protein OEV42_10565 [Deltaproteobacteria bacterium]|nr:hypothetical protein [Deltaproteobacteria bacterium]
MLTEFTAVRQDEGGIRKRWFGDEFFDLILWQDGKGKIVKFELCYDKEINEHAFSWSKKAGLTHLKVDDGEGEAGRYKMSPILVADGVFDNKKIAEKFLDESVLIEKSISQFIYHKILAFSLS